MPVKYDSSSATWILLLLASVLSIILGALSWARTTALSLPLPTWIPALATLLPPLTILTLTTFRLFLPNTSQTPQRWTQPLHLLNQLHTILLTTIATIALAYLFPGNTLACHLEQQWQAFFQQKNAPAIRAIQDRFQCCGFRSIHDRAWPFKDRDHGDNACELQFGYRRSCIEPWGDVQRGASWMVFAAAVGVFLVKIGVVQFSGRRTSWMSSRFLGNGRTTQRISAPELEEGDGDGENDGEARRTMLPHSRPGQENVWDVD
ncbi:hypothetical protein BJX76DRAFT_353409 [Aspergillus varians]